jgi:HSP20 family molecular chaperone IbpA
MAAMTDNPRQWMWSEALDALARVERLRREMFRLPTAAPAAYWEPPVDVLETDDKVVIVVALPGVCDAAMRLAIVDGALVIQGERALPPELYRARIHRLELPQGRFERRVPLPAGRYRDIGHKTQDGCVIITLVKQA